jgi:hypothetical protein
MAIPFLNNINLDDNQLLNAKLHVTSSAPTAAAGQIYFDSTAGVTSAKYYDGSAWVSLIQHTYNNGTFINLTEAGTDATRTLTADLSATGTPDATVYLRGDNTWSPISAIPGTYTFDVAADSGTDQTVNSDDTLEIHGISYITTTVGAGPVIEIRHDDTSRTDTTSTDAPGYGGTFEAVTSVTTNATGHVTAIDVSTVTIPASDNTDDYVDSISFSTGTGVLTLGRTGALSDLTQDLDGRYLELDGGTMTGDIDMDTNQITNLQDPTNAQDAATKAYVDAATVGGLVYQGGYDANLNSPDLTTSPNSIEKGWTYTVTNDGTFFGEQLRVGDVLIAEVDDPSALADWTTVQNNIDLASASQVGIGNVAAGTGISVSYSNGTATVTNTDTNTSNTASGQITAGSTSGTVTHNFASNKVIVQTYLDNATDNYPVVYCDITRTANSVTATIATAETSDIIILVQKIG